MSNDKPIEENYSAQPSFRNCPSLKVFVIATDSFRSVSDQIYNDYDFASLMPKRGVKPNLTIVLDVILSNLITAYNKNPEFYLRVSLNERNPIYKKSSRYNAHGLSKKIVPVLKHMVSKGLIVMHKGYFDRESGNSSQTRIKATSLLTSYFEGVETDSVDHGKRESIVLKSADNALIDYKDNAEVVRMRENLEVYNRLLSNTTITIGGKSVYTEDYSTKPDHDLFGMVVTHDLNQDKFVKRVFNRGDWYHGGRFYGGAWQQLPSRTRKKLEINGKRVVEIDYSGLHIRIIAAQCGINLGKKDPYKVGVIDPSIHSNEQRRILKLIILISINAKSVLEACRSFTNKHSNLIAHVDGNKHDYIKSYIERFVEAHPWAKDFICTDAGIKLMTEDAAIAESVIMHFANKGVPVLCVHDSFIVDADYTEELEKVMREVTVVKYGMEFHTDYEGATEEVEEPKSDELETIYDFFRTSKRLAPWELVDGRTEFTNLLVPALKEAANTNAILADKALLEDTTVKVFRLHKKLLSKHKLGRFGLNKPTHFTQPDNFEEAQLVVDLLDEALNTHLNRR